MKVADLPEAIARKIEVDSSSGCWLWTGCPFVSGYGCIWWHGVSRRVHRLTYELLVGEIAAGLQLDHLCRVRPCCNPEHLEQVTARENTLRGNGPTALNARKTECHKGHPFAPGSYTERVRHGRIERCCVECRRQRYRA